MNGKTVGDHLTLFLTLSLTLNLTLTLTLTLLLTLTLNLTLTRFLTLNLTLNVTVIGLGGLPRFCENELTTNVYCLRLCGRIQPTLILQFGELPALCRMKLLISVRSR